MSVFSLYVFVVWIFLFRRRLRRLLLVFLLLKRQSIAKRNACGDLANSKPPLLPSEMHSFYAAWAHASAYEYGSRFRSSRARALPFRRPPPWRLPRHAFSTVFVAATSRRHKALLMPKTLAKTCTPTASREKTVRVLSRGMSRRLRKNFFLAQLTPNHRFLAPLR